ncbi:MAG TPA: YfhO family protein [Candidatus Blautia faecavium]|uniref:YfhO family protein n=1 Tax=Candidatus Blautia faecavium TaxID=2838487 RepID=A0A9D2LPQ5_9FIRM|nr:YfhO family protein [Candidatus Blautia faecavium]
MKKSVSLLSQSKKTFPFFMGEDRKKFYFFYTILASLLCLSIFFILFFSGKSSIWENDPIKQHYIALAYYGEYLRTILKNFLVDHTFEVPMWDLHIGFGTDILQTLHYYAIGDPLNLLAVFVPEEYTEYLFEFLIFLRMYLAGITFSRLCFYQGSRQTPALMGSMIYISSMWMISVGFNHIFFLVPSVYFPLMLLGVDKVFKEKKPLTYICATAVSALANYYFFYMMGIFTVIYGIFRYFVLYKGWKWKVILEFLARFFLYSVTGIFISAVILLPVLSSTVAADRFSMSYFIPTLYSTDYYQELPVALTSGRMERYTLIGVAGVCALALTIILMKRKRFSALKGGVLLFALLFCIPYAGHVLNGFSYVNNRWSFAAVVFFPYLFVKVYPEFFTLSKKERWVLFFTALAYGTYIIWYPATRRIGSVLGGIGVILPAFLLLFIKKKQAVASVLAGSIALSGAANVLYAYNLKDGEWVRARQNLDIGEANKMVHADVYEGLKEQPDIDKYRYEQATTTIYNTAMLNQLNSGQFYFSIAPEGISDFFDDNYVITLMEQVIHGVNGRAWLMKLFGMKYYIGTEDTVPYGFVPLEPETIYSNGEQIYVDTSPVPLAYTYDRYIPQETYEQMSGEQRQEAMLQGVVLQESDLPLCEPEFTSSEVPYEIIRQRGVEVSENEKIEVKRKGAGMILEVEGDALCETYVSFENFQYHGWEWEEASVFEGNYADEASIKIELLDEGKSGNRTITLRSYKNDFLDNRGNFTANLGYHEEGVKRIKITFNQPGTYSFDNMRVVCQEMDTLDDYAVQRTEDQIKDFSYSGNTISCSLTLDQPKALVFAVPYSEGWSLLVDGEAAEIKKANGMFMAAELGAGSHRVELRYETPYIRAGALCTLAGMGAAGILFFYERKKKVSRRADRRKEKSQRSF